MATATFHSLRGEKSALVMLKVNAFVFGGTPVYIPRACVSGLEPGATLEIPDGYRIVDMVGEDGEVRHTESGEPLKVLAY